MHGLDSIAYVVGCRLRYLERKLPSISGELRRYAEIRIGAFEAVLEDIQRLRKANSKGDESNSKEHKTKQDADGR